MFIKIYKKSQLLLLRSLLAFFKERYRLPKEILDTAGRALGYRKLGRTGFVAILPIPIRNDMVEIRDILNLYPHELKIKGDVIDVPTETQDTWLTKDRQWYMDILKIKGENSHIYVIYSITIETLYGKPK